MANKYANLVGTNKIKDEYTKINIGFDGVETDINALNNLVDALDSRVDTIITTPISGEAAAQELVDARAGFSTIGGRMTKIEEDIETHKADNTAHGMPHKNLLHNWDFRNPVNQRGLTSYNATGYSIDRWKLSSAAVTLTVQNSNIKVAMVGGSDIRQYIENAQQYRGKTLTFSIELASPAVEYPAFAIYDDVSRGVDGLLGKTAGIYTVTYTVDSAATELYVRIFGNQLGATHVLEISRVKLELGSVSTLANDPPADYGEQLMLCKRFSRLWTTEAARTEALKEVGLMRIPNPTLGTIDISGTTYYYASADL